MSKIHHALLYAIRACFIVLAILFLIRIFVDPDYNKWGGVIAGIGLPFLPIIAERLFKFRMSFRFQLIYYVFLFVALDLGICMDLYKTVPYFDKFVHFGSGVLSAFVGYYALVFFKTTKSPKAFRVLFIIFASITIAVAWEFFEFACDKFLGQSMQQLVSVGVDDTMFDLLSATVGSVLGVALLAIPGFTEELEKQ